MHTPLPPQTDTPSGPARHSQTPPAAQEEPGTARLCTRLELRALEAEGLSLCPASVSPRALGPASRDGAALRAVPEGLGVHSSSSCSACGSALRPHLLGQPLGTEPAQPGGSQCPQSALSPVAPQRAQSIDHPALSSTLGEPVLCLPPAPDLAPAGHTWPGVEASVFIPGWGGHVGARRAEELRSRAGLGWCQRLPGCCRTRLILLAFFFFSF